MYHIKLSSCGVTRRLSVVIKLTMSEANCIYVNNGGRWNVIKYLGCNGADVLQYCEITLLQIWAMSAKHLDLVLNAVA